MSGDKQDRSEDMITVGVYGGQVQWVTGNTVPVRIIDYDGESEDFPNQDADGNPCRIWIEPAQTTGV